MLTVFSTRMLLSTEELRVSPFTFSSGLVCMLYPTSSFELEGDHRDEIQPSVFSCSTFETYIQWDPFPKVCLASPPSFALRYRLSRPWYMRPKSMDPCCFNNILWIYLASSNRHGSCLLSPSLGHQRETCSGW